MTSNRYQSFFPPFETGVLNCHILISAIRGTCHSRALCKCRIKLERTLRIRLLKYSPVNVSAQSNHTVAKNHNNVYFIDLCGEISLCI